MEIKKTYIYRYKEKGGSPLCIYLCDTQIKNRILIIPLTANGSGNVYKLSVTNQYADLDNYKEINKASITSALFLNSKPVQIPDTDLKTIQSYVIDNLMNKICADSHKSNSSLQLFESIYQFLKWKHQKFLLNFLPFAKKTTVYENGLYWASLGVNVGSELNKNRPVLIWKKRCSGTDESNYSYIAIPITSKAKSKRYYMNVPVDINGQVCYLRIEDMRRINIRRISRPILDTNNNIIFIDNSKRKEIMEAIEKFYIFENKHNQS
jgi:mRNA-degrading endonuclease toxin of MazEF toxin-antitoxin module